MLNNIDFRIKLGITFGKKKGFIRSGDPVSIL
jgi:hypothetical protein